MKSFQHMLLSSLVLLAMQDQGAVATDVCHSSDTDESQCKDSPLNFELNGKTRDCAWVAKKPKKRCKKSEVKSHCPVTCLMLGSFKPGVKATFQHAVTAWIADPTAAAINYGPINDWDTSLITDMSYLFYQASAFNHDISNWNTAAVTTMRSMFYSASAFNQDLSNWDIAAVTNMQSMFHRATSFNGDLSNWDIAAVTNMQYMFVQASSFNQELCWSLKEGVDQTASFDGSGGSFGCRFKPEDKAELQDAITAWISDPTAAAINYGPINAWDTSLITDMSILFGSRSSFNDEISNWNTEAVTDMEFMFSRALFFNGDISNWNTATVTNMGFMFREASAFNHDLSNWDIAAVTNMQYMFVQASSFNQELSWSLKEGVVQTGIFDGSGGSFGFNYDLTIPLDTQPP